ncbi:MAG: hypothetical protein DI538_29745 [Azospira oryzae]|nr:MAG: hypothetical protein DI538_29745 [Azospira oryzae]
MGCNKKNDSACAAGSQYAGPVQVVKNANGTYIRYKGKDYRVCNEYLLKYYSDGASATMGFSPVGNCPGEDRYLYYEETITINCIR